MNANQQGPKKQSTNMKSTELDKPLPRPQRRRRRAKSDRGLPPDSELARLAVAYLDRQRKHWPEMVKAGLLPEACDEIVVHMVEDFKHRHRTGEVDPESVRAFAKICRKLAGNYDRYSCENSSPTSILDQLVHALDKARQEVRFVPWPYVFADYSVSGLDSDRLGYQSYKKVLASKEHQIETTYVDDFTRASRDQNEWWKLATLSRRLGKRMIGASDGFDLSSQNWDMQVGMYGLISQQHIKGLREKVARGMHGAARRRTCLGKQSLGFTRCVCRDEQGNVVRGADGQAIHRPCIDPETAPARLRLYELFVQSKWSLYRITRDTNQHKVDGWDGWSESGIRELLHSPTAIGVFIWNKTRREFDYEVNKWVTVENPRQDWEVYYDPDLAIVPVQLWAAARRRLSELRRASPRTGKKPSRNQASATTLFSGTLFCECNRELTLGRSRGKYKVMHCTNGSMGAHGCQLSTSKSTRIIEECLLGYLKDQLLTEARIDDMVVRANTYLMEEVQRPRTDTRPLQGQIRKLDAAIKKLLKRVEDVEDEDLCNAYDRQIKEHERERKRLRAELRQIEVKDVVPPEPLDRTRVKTYVADLRALLNQEIPAAAEAIRGLTGPITIRQEVIPGKRGALWIATFKPNLLGSVRQIGKENKYPDSITLEYLSSRNWITPETVEVRLEKVPTYERIAPAVGQLAAKGANVLAISRVIGCAQVTVQEALEFLQTSRRPNPKPTGRKDRKRGGPPKYIVIKDDVVRLRDQEGLSFEKIAEQLSVSDVTVRRAYDEAHPGAVRVAAETGRPTVRGFCSRLSADAQERIISGLKAHEHPKDIAVAARCSLSTVLLYRKRLRAEPGNAQISRRHDGDHRAAA